MMKRIKRNRDWRPALVAYLNRSARQPFRPGGHDCALFAAGAVEAMTGTDFARRYRSKYRSLAKGQAILRKRGYADHVDMVAQLLPEIVSKDGNRAPMPIMAQEGDIAVVPQGDEMALGVVQGSMVYVLRPGHLGLGLVPLTDAVRAFRVGAPE